jgi:Cu2+-exporting ATPase
VEDARPLEKLSARERDVLYTLVAASVHPKSAAVARALQGSGAKLLEHGRATEVAGQGLVLTDTTGDYRFGRAAWALGDAQATAGDPDLVFARDGVRLCALRTAETLRSDAAREVAALQRDGYELSILSGDAPERVQTLARELDIAPDHAFGGHSPHGKAEWISARDRGDTLMIGDGINDSLAVERAFASGTPAIDRAFMPWRSDFYFVSAGLAPIRLALRAARKLARVIRFNQVFAVTYNAGVMTLAACGWMKPWMAAALMPASSIVVLLATSFSLSARSSLWKS